MIIIIIFSKIQYILIMFSFFFFDIGNLKKEIPEILAKFIQICTRKINLFGWENDKVCWRGKEKKNHWNFDFLFTISDNDNNDIIILTNINSAFFYYFHFA
jgi:hypothetical protein